MRRRRARGRGRRRWEVVKAASPGSLRAVGFRKYKYNQIHRTSAMKIEETLKARREEILAIAEKYGVRNVRIFGSVARGEADDRSDLEEALPPEGDGILK
jgi:hypothetical protein